MFSSTNPVTLWHMKIYSIKKIGKMIFFLALAALYFYNLIS